MDRILGSRIAQAFSTPSTEKKPAKPADPPKKAQTALSAEHVKGAVGQEAGKSIKAALPKPGPAVAGQTTATATSAVKAAVLHGTTSPVTSAAAATPAQPAALFKPKSGAPFNQKAQEKLFKALRPEALALTKKYGLTKTEAAAIHAYTKNTYYENMNGALRQINKRGDVDVCDPAALKNAGIADDELALMIASAVSGMKKLPPTQTSETFFESLGRNDSIPDEFLEAYQEGATVVIPAFYSTTVSLNVVEQWWDNKDHALCVLQRTNGNGRDVSAFSEFANEKEVLFLPGTQFMVIARTAATVTPAGKVDKKNPDATKIKVLMHVQEISLEEPLPPSISAVTFNQPPAVKPSSPPTANSSATPGTATDHSGNEAS